MKINRKLTIGGALGLAFAFSIFACGKVDETSDIPKAVDDLTTDDVDDETIKAGIARWDEIQEGLGIKGKALTETSSLLGDATEVATLVGLHTSSLYATRCASVTAFSQWEVVPTALDRDGTTGVAAKIYKMKYKLKASTSAAEENARTALVVVPDGCSSNSCPIVPYAHGGDRGLSYADIAGFFGDKQANHIIVAPTFPGEPLCKSGVSSGTDKTSCDSVGVDEVPVGTSIPWDNDVDDLMGVQNCLVKSFISKASGGSFFSALDNAIVTKVKTISTDNTKTFYALPLTIMAGFSRGALVADLAIARAGAALTAALTYVGGGGSLATYVNTKTGEPANSAGIAWFTTIPSCSIHMAGPAGSTMGIGRVLAELVVKGNVEQSNLYGLPGVPQLNALVSGYRDGSGSVSKSDVINMLAKRDVPLNAPLMQASLRDWSTFTLGASLGGTGKMLIMHGAGDKVVPTSDSQVIGNVMGGVFAAVHAGTSAPGVLAAPVIFEKTSSGSDHGDAGFHASVAYQPSAFWSTDALNTFATTYLGWGSYDGKTPAQTLAAWRTNVCNL